MKGLSHFLGSESLNKNRRHMKVVKINPKGSNNKRYTNKINKVKDGLISFFQFHITEVFSFSSSSPSADLLRGVGKVRISPKIPNNAPDKKGKNPGPGV
jgi:hypothetical protein